MVRFMALAFQQNVALSVPMQSSATHMIINRMDTCSTQKYNIHSLSQVNESEWTLNICVHSVHTVHVDVGKWQVDCKNQYEIDECKVYAPLLHNSLNNVRCTRREWEKKNSEAYSYAILRIYVKESRCCYVNTFVWRYQWIN